MALYHEGVRSLAVTMACLIISVLAVFLRFWCKLVLKTGLHGDDWCILVGIIAHAGGTCGWIWGIYTGSHGQDMPEIIAQFSASPTEENLHQIENYLESLFISATFSYLVLYSVKMSILLLYRRIFSTRRYRTTSTILMAIASACSTITNIIRIYYSYQPHNKYLVFSKTTLWTNIHVMTTIVCACLPVYTPVRALADRLITSLRETCNSTWKSMFTRSKPKASAYHRTGLELSGYKDGVSDVNLVLSPKSTTTRIVAFHRSEASQASTSPHGGISRTTKVERSVEFV
ncbi:hypothetical protein VM1G_09488 [Cytospora mali]|uniref:Rhodopsin domain-containing protein n=1 Tax=Cytospora mali TaxID=578113 RepID=A0A194WCN7_CYTMA|nr:hypothetical protein VM1G_09488 [Valsa mali]